MDPANAKSAGSSTLLRHAQCADCQFAVSFPRNLVLLRREADRYN